MQQRQLRLGDILDDYCPRERRLTNHAIVAMVGDDVKQTRCTTCEAEHEYKRAKVPRQRKKTDTPAVLYSQVAEGAPKRVQHEPRSNEDAAPESSESVAGLSGLTGEPSRAAAEGESAVRGVAEPDAAFDAGARAVDADGLEEQEGAVDIEEGPVHRPLIRATLPRTEGQPPPTRPPPEFTIRQPGGRSNRFHPRSHPGGLFQGNRANGNMGGPMRGGAPHAGGGRPPHGEMTPRIGRRRGRKRSK